MTVTKQPTRAVAIPEEFFNAIAYLLPGLNQVAQECGITIGQFIILWDIEHRGAMNDESNLVMLRQDLSSSLGNRGFGEANITRLLNSLEDQGHVRRTSLTQSERNRFFRPSERENRRAVVLQPAGRKKIDEFKEQLTLLVDKWRRSERPLSSRKTLTATTEILLQCAEWFLKSASPDFE